MSADKNMIYVIAAYGFTIVCLMGMFYSVVHRWWTTKKEHKNKLPQKNKT